MSNERADSAAWTPSLGSALVDHWRAAGTILLVCVAVAAVLGLSIPVRYVAQAQGIAGATSVSAAATPAYTEAGRALAETYSRVFAGDDVQGRLRDSVQSRDIDISASPIAGSSIVLVEAQAPSGAEAVDAADAGVDALVVVVDSLLSNQGSVDQASRGLAEANQRLAAAQVGAGVDATGEPAVGTSPDALAQLLTARAEVEAYRALLTETVRNSVQANGVQRLSSATVVSDNRVRRLQLSVGAGTVLGLLLACGVAYWRAAQSHRDERSPAMLYGR